MDKELRILILEDVPTDAELVKYELKKAEIAFTSRHVETRDSFLKELEDFSPDIVLSDYMMPQFTGREALELVKERYPSIPLIIVTGSMNEETAVECMKAGAVDYVIKENLIRLGQAVVGALEKKKLKEQKEKTEKALRESEKKYRTVLEANPDPVVVYDMEGKVIYFNPAFTRVFGWTLDERFGKKMDVFVPEKNRPETEMMIEKVLAGESFSGIESRRYNKEGKIIPVSISGAVYRDQEGNPVGNVVNLQDITDRVLAKKSLKESHETFLTVLDSIDATIYVADMETYEILFMNKHMQDSFGTDFTGKICWKAFRNGFGPCSHCTNDKLLDEEGNPAGVQVWDDHNPVTGRWYINYDRAIKWIDGRYVRLQVATDITDFKKMEDQLRQAQKMEAIGVLAGGVAHDFNNILTVIIGNAELALMEVGKDDTLRKEIEEIKIAGERAAALTRQLLAFSRKQVIQPKILDLNELLTDMEKMLGRLIGEDVELLTIPGTELWQVEADPGQIEQVIMNLVVNAKDAMPMGGKLTVETTNVDLGGNYFREHGIEDQPGSYVMLAVSDTGIGMDKETQEHIFEPFFTTKEIGKGTGLGLSTVYGIVKQNNGFIWAYSEPGQGTTFKVYFPVVKGDAELEEKERTHVVELGGSETVFIVEDDDSLRKLMRIVLKQNGYKVLEAENGEDALRVIEEYEGSIDLLITDVVMPKMGGKEVAERLQPLYPQMKVIYMSGYTDNAIAHHGVLEPGLNFIEKPFPPEGLARKVREVLDKKQD